MLSSQFRIPSAEPVTIRYAEGTLAPLLESTDDVAAVTTPAPAEDVAVPGIGWEILGAAAVAIVAFATCLAFAGAW